MTSDDDDKRHHSPGVWLILLPVISLFSSGPMLGLGFWLREATGWDEWYAVMFLYWPLLAGLHHRGIGGGYIEWWVVDVFDTVGPG